MIAKLALPEFEIFTKPSNFEYRAFMKTWADGKLPWLALRMIPKLGNVTYMRLLEKFGEPARVFEAGLKELTDTPGVYTSTAQKIRSRAWEGDPEAELKRAKQLGARVVTFLDDSYPGHLREIHNPPAILYIKGNEIPGKRTIVGVIGSRNPSHYGLKITQELCQGLSRRNVVVVSGMATGIDSTAHWGCLRGKGFTIAVLGSGIDVVYPRNNTGLFDSIVKNGCVVSEFPLGSPPEAKNFPIRNRIISGLSEGVVVVEASRKSGSLITASLALEQGRDVFAVPGSIESFKSMGTHLLIKQGAKLVENADDILQELGLSFSFNRDFDTWKQRELPPMEKEERVIFDILENYPIHIDHIARISKMDPSLVSSILTGLELKGVVKQLPGKMFLR